MEVVNSFFLEGGKVFKKPKAGSWAITDVLVSIARAEIPDKVWSEFGKPGGTRK